MQKYVIPAIDNSSVYSPICTFIAVIQEINSIMRKIEHIGIAVHDIESANTLFSSLLNTNPYKMEEVESEGYVQVFLSLAKAKLNC